MWNTSCLPPLFRKEEAGRGVSQTLTKRPWVWELRNGGSFPTSGGNSEKGGMRGFGEVGILHPHPHPGCMAQPGPLRMSPKSGVITPATDPPGFPPFHQVPWTREFGVSCLRVDSVLSCSLHHSPVSPAAPGTEQA